MVQLFHKLLGECLGLIGAVAYGSHYRTIGLQSIVMELLPSCAGLSFSFRANRVFLLDLGLVKTRSGPLKVFCVIVSIFNLILIDRSRAGCRFLLLYEITPKKMEMELRTGCRFGVAGRRQCWTICHHPSGEYLLSPEVDFGDPPQK